MMDSPRSAFSVCVALAVIAGGWAYSWYTVTSAIFSDLAPYGIVYGSEAYAEIVSLTQRHILLISIPIAVVLGVTLFAWAYQLFATPARYEERPKTETDDGTTEHHS